MHVKLFVILMTCVMVINSQSTVSAGDFVQCDDSIESIRQLLMTQQQASGCKECQAIKEIKSQIEEIRKETRKIVSELENRRRRGLS